MDNQHYNIDLQDVEKAFNLFNVSCFFMKFVISLHRQNMYLSSGKMLWLSPVLKCSCPKSINDFRLVALTSVLMKIFEKLVRSEILRKTEHALEPSLHVGLMGHMSDFYL